MTTKMKLAAPAARAATAGEGGSAVRPAPTPLTKISAALPRVDGDSLAIKKTTGRKMADAALQPSFGAAVVTQAYLGSSGGEMGVTDLIDALKASTDEMSSGDMSRVDAMLLCQAHALQAIFVDLARRSVGIERPEHREASLRMALKAQNQCRMTLETLATVKNPPTVFARQANIAHGPQQVNNGVALPVAAPTRGNSAE